MSTKKSIEMWKYIKIYKIREVPDDASDDDTVIDECRWLIQ